MSPVTEVSGIYWGDRKEGLQVLCVHLASSSGRGPRADVALAVVNSSPSRSVLSNGLCRPGGGGREAIPSSDSAFFPPKMTRGLQTLPQWPSGLKAGSPKHCWDPVADTASPMAPFTVGGSGHSVVFLEGHLAVRCRRCSQRSYYGSGTMPGIGFSLKF